MLPIWWHFEPARSVNDKEKEANRCASKIAQGKKLEVGEEVRRRSLQENFTTDVRQRLLMGKFGSWRRSPSKIAPRKFPNRCVRTLGNVNINRWNSWDFCTEIGRFSTLIQILIIVVRNCYISWVNFPTRWYHFSSDVNMMCPRNMLFHIYFSSLPDGSLIYKYFYSQFNRGIGTVSSTQNGDAISEGGNTREKTKFWTLERRKLEEF